MASKRSPPAVDLSLLLNQASYALANRLAAALAELDTTVRAYCVLAKAIAGERTQGQLAELTFMDKTTMVVTLDELERQGLAERRLSPTDRRVRVVAVTREGELLLAKADRMVQGIHDELLGGVPDEQRAAFVAVLEHLVAGPLAAPSHLERPTRRRRQRSAVSSR